MMIFIGYQGIGKSTLSGKDNFIDLESSNFKVNGERIPNWYIPYTNIAIDLSNQGYKVFISSHREIRDLLSSCLGQKVYTITPDISLKEAWVNKLRERWLRTNLVKDKLALMNAESKYEENIREILNDPFENIIIDSMDYDLHSILSRYS